MSDDPYSPPGAPVRDVTPARAAAQRPRNVDLAVRLLWISLVASIPISIREYQDAASNGNGTFLLYFILALYAISIVINVFIHRGSHFARMALLVFTVLNVLSFVGGMQQILAYPAGDLVAVAVSMLLDFAALVLVFTRPGARWFKRADAA